MFLDQRLKSIQMDKDRLVMCSDLRRRLVQIEFQGIGAGAGRTISRLTLGFLVAGQVVNFLRERKKRP